MTKYDRETIVNNMRICLILGSKHVQMIIKIVKTEDKLSFLTNVLAHQIRKNLNIAVRQLSFIVKLKNEDNESTHGRIEMVNIE